MPYPYSLLFPSPSLYPGDDSTPLPLVIVLPVTDTPDLLSDLPPFEQESTDIQTVLRVIADEFALIENTRAQLLLNFFPDTAEMLLPFFEQMLGLTPNAPGLSLAQRQQAVVAFYRRLKNQGTGLEWEDAITELVGTSWTYAEHQHGVPGSPPNYTVLVTIPFPPGALMPTGLTVGPGSGGSLAPGTYYYAISATTTWGETLACGPVSYVVSGGDARSTWTAQTAPCTGYNVYRGTSPSVLYKIGKIADPTVATFDDDGSFPLSAQPKPIADTSGSALAGQAVQLIRSITPAHLALEFDFTGGFVIGQSLIGIDNI